MAASIPMLRALLHEAASSPAKRYQARLEEWRELNATTQYSTDIKNGMVIVESSEPGRSQSPPPKGGGMSNAPVEEIPDTVQKGGIERSSRPISRI